MGLKRMYWTLGLLLTACSPLVMNGGERQDVEMDSGIEEVGGVESDSDILFNEDSIPSFEIEISEEAFDSLRNDPYTWVEGSFHYDGRTWSPVGIRLKGENSFSPIDEKPSIKVKFNKYVSGGEFLGLRELTLNNMFSDYSMMHERITYRMYREFGVPAARSHHALLTLNGEDYGLYANVENVDRRMMRRWFDDSDGPLFEVWDVDFYDGYIPYFELEYGEDDRTNLQGVADTLETGGASSLAALEEHLSLEAFLRYWAVGAYVAQFDAYPYSNPGDDCHVYDDPTTGTLHFLPHGADETFYYNDSEVDWANGILGVRCLEVPECRSTWIELVQEVLVLAEEIGIVDYFDTVSDQIEEHVREDSHKPYGNYYVWSYQDHMRNMLVTRESWLSADLGF